MILLNIPLTARVVWNTLDDTTMVRESEESLFLATFDDAALNFKDRHQIDYSYYNRGYYAENPKFILEVYTCGEIDNEASNTTYHFEKRYYGIHDAMEDINYWMNHFKHQTRI